MEQLFDIVKVYKTDGPGPYADIKNRLSVCGG